MSSWVRSWNVKEAGIAFKTGWMFSVEERNREWTSAVSVDVEGYIYSHCRKVGITLFTVSHRKSLWKHHDFYLHMDGRGNYEFKKITEETVEFGS